jgi:predicted DNA binding CopG/RHH family protein
MAAYGFSRHGSVEMTPEELEQSRNPMIRTTIFLEEDLIRAYKREAAKRGIKYQQLMREKLRSGLSESSDIENRLRRLEEKVLKRA